MRKRWKGISPPVVAYRIPRGDRTDLKEDVLGWWEVEKPVPEPLSGLLVVHQLEWVLAEEVGRMPGQPREDGRTEPRTVDWTHDSSVGVVVDHTRFVPVGSEHACREERGKGRAREREKTLMGEPEPVDVRC